jgi:hypothetical protein
LGEIVRFGIHNDFSSIPDLWEFYSKLVDDEMPIARRQAVFDETKRLVTNTDFVSANAFLPFICVETEKSIVSTAVLDFVSLAPSRDDDPMSTSMDMISFIVDGKVANPGAVFGGLLHVGDPRLCELLLPLRHELDSYDLNVGITCVSGYLSAATIEFELSWLEDPDISSSLFGSVASGLVLQRRAAMRPIVMTGQRPFPVTSASPEEQHAMARYVSLEEYTARIAPRLYAIAEAEAAPKLMSFVIEEWGLGPARHETVAPPDPTKH